METWHDPADIPWLQHPRDGERPALAGLVLGRGRAHLRVSALGSLDAAAEVLRRDLGRPTETREAGTTEVEVVVRVGLEDTLVVMAGPPSALHDRLQRLDAVLRDPNLLELSTAARAHPEVPLQGWSRELTAWFGPGAAALATEVVPRHTGAEPTVAEAVASLHPMRGCAAVGFTTEEDLVGTVFTDHAAPSASDDGLRWRARGPESLVPTFANNLLSARMAPSLAGGAAERVLVQTVQRAMAVSGEAEGLLVTTAAAAGERLLLVRASTDDGYDREAGHRAVLSAVELCREADQQLLEQHLEQLRGQESVQALLSPVAMAARALQSGRRQSSVELLRELEELTPADVGRELRASLDRLLLGLPAGLTPPPGFPLAPGPEPVRGSGLPRHHPSMVLLPSPDGRQLRTDVTRRGDALVVRTGSGQRGPVVAEETVDLSRVAARIDRGETYTVLVDEEGRRAGLPWLAITRAGALRRALDTVVPDDRRLRLPADTQYDYFVTDRRRTARRILWAVGVSMALVVVFIIVMESIT